MSEDLVPSWFVFAVVAAYGLVFGSFLNVVIYRVPRELSILRPRSHCPGCGALVRWFDNVPVLSFLVLRGRCRQCGAAISPRYPLVELAAAGLLVAVVARFALTRQALAAGVLALLLLPLGLIDLEHKLLPDVLTLPGLAAGLALTTGAAWSRCATQRSARRSGRQSRGRSCWSTRRFAGSRGWASVTSSYSP